MKDVIVGAFKTIILQKLVTGGHGPVGPPTSASLKRGHKQGTLKD